MQCWLLQDINRRDRRKKREEAEAEANERRRQKEKDQKFREQMDAAARHSTRNIARMYGLPENAFDHLTLPSALTSIRTKRVAPGYGRVDRRMCAHASAPKA